MTEKELRQKYVDVMLGWKGRKEADGSHKPIIDLYNSQKKLPRGYKVKYTDSWCATTVSAAAMKAGLTAIIPIECSCYYIVELAKAMKNWKEADNYQPKLGDIVLYDWQDGANYAKTDNVGTPDHIGVVTKVSGSKFTVTEGNKNDAVCDREMVVNGKYIRGFICPNFASRATKEEAKPATTKKETKPAASKPVITITATERAKTLNKNVAGKYKVTSAALNMRNGAGTKKAIIIELPKGTEVMNYGYYTEEAGVKWLYVEAKYNGRTYIGFCSSKYLRKA